MIAFGCSISKPEVFRRCALAGIDRVAEADSPRLFRPANEPIARSYNALLDQAAGLVDLEALVLVHQDAELVGTGFCAVVRDALRDPSVGLVGCAGAVGVRSIAWWEGSVSLASFVNRYDEYGGGDLESFSWRWQDAPPWARVGEVETLDGFVLVCAPWVVRHVRFDEELSRFDGYDLDFCLQVRLAGRRVVTADFRAVHHRRLEMLPDPENWIEAHIAVADKWEGRSPGLGAEPGDWRDRALRAEAERDLARAIAHTKAIEQRARAAHLERALAEARGSLSWRLTGPLRALTRR